MHQLCLNIFYFHVVQPIPQKREDRPVSCFLPGSTSSQPNMAALARDVVNAVREKQRGLIPSMMCNETYGTMMDLSPPPPILPMPQLPPRNPLIGKLHLDGSKTYYTYTCCMLNMNYLLECNDLQHTAYVCCIFRSWQLEAYGDSRETTILLRPAQSYQSREQHLW